MNCLTFWTIKGFFSLVFTPPFKYLTIWQPDTNLPFEYQTSPVFRWLWHTLIFHYPLFYLSPLNQNSTPSLLSPTTLSPMFQATRKVTSQPSVLAGARRWKTLYTTDNEQACQVWDHKNFLIFLTKTSPFNLCPNNLAFLQKCIYFLWIFGQFFGKD